MSNFARDVLDAAPAAQRAIVELARDGTRREWTFGEVSERSARLAATLAARGVGRGDVVMTIIGNRPEWVLTMLAAFAWRRRAPGTEQLRAKDSRCACRRRVLRSSSPTSEISPSSRRRDRIVRCSRSRRGALGRAAASRRGPSSTPRTQRW